MKIKMKKEKESKKDCSGGCGTGASSCGGGGCGCGDPEKATEAFIREVNEDLAADRLKRIWKQYGLWIVAGAAALLTLAVSFEGIQAWRAKRGEARAEAYAAAVSLQARGRFAESAKILEALAGEGSGAYADIAQMQLANLMFDEGKDAEALAYLEKLAADRRLNPQMRNAAIVKLASRKLDTAPAAEVSALLAPLAESGGAWAGIAREMLAMLYIRDNDLAKAREAYAAIANMPDADDELKARAADMLSVLDGK